MTEARIIPLRPPAASAILDALRSVPGDSRDHRLMCWTNPALVVDGVEVSGRIAAPVITVRVSGPDTGEELVARARARYLLALERWFRGWAFPLVLVPTAAPRDRRGVVSR